VIPVELGVELEGLRQQQQAYLSETAYLKAEIERIKLKKS
jgi:hypothetical protein